MSGYQSGTVTHRLLGKICFWFCLFRNINSWELHGYMLTNTPPLKLITLCHVMNSIPVAARHGTISISALPLPASSRVIGSSVCDDGIGSVHRKRPEQPFYERGVGQGRGQQSDWPTSVLFPLLITAKVCRRYRALSCRFSHWTAGLVSGIENMDVVQKLSGGTKLRFRPPPAPVTATYRTWACWFSAYVPKGHKGSWLRSYCLDAVRLERNHLNAELLI